MVEKSVLSSGDGLKKKYVITKACLCKFDPLKPHFYKAKLGFTGVHIIVFYFCSQT